MRVIKKQEQANLEIESLSQTVPEALMAEATRKIKEVKQFSEELEADVAELTKRTEEVKEKLASKLYEDGNIRGFLTHSLETYRSCLGDIDGPQLQALMREDLNLWEKALRETERNKNS